MLPKQLDKMNPKLDSIANQIHKNQLTSLKLRQRLTSVLIRFDKPLVTYKNL